MTSSESALPVNNRTLSRIQLLGMLLAISAVACGSHIQSTKAAPWLNIHIVLVMQLPELRGELGRQGNWAREYEQGYRQALLVAGLGWALVTAG